MTLSAGDKGEWAKATVVAALLRAGLETYRAVSPAAGVQLIVTHEPPDPVRLHRVAVRSAQRKPRVNDHDRVAFVGAWPSECDVLALAMPDDTPPVFVGAPRGWDVRHADLGDGGTVIVCPTLAEVFAEMTEADAAAIGLIKRRGDVIAEELADRMNLPPGTRVEFDATPLPLLQNVPGDEGPDEGCYSP